MSDKPRIGKPGGAKRVSEMFERIRKECRTSVQEEFKNYTGGIEAETNVNQVIDEDSWLAHFSQTLNQPCCLLTVSPSLKPCEGSCYYEAYRAAGSPGVEMSSYSLTKNSAKD